MMTLILTIATAILIINNWKKLKTKQDTDEKETLKIASIIVTTAYIVMFTTGVLFDIVIVLIMALIETLMIRKLQDKEIIEHV